MDRAHDGAQGLRGISDFLRRREARRLTSQQQPETLALAEFTEALAIGAAAAQIVSSDRQRHLAVDLRELPREERRFAVFLQPRRQRGRATQRQVGDDIEPHIEIFERIEMPQ